MANCVIKAAVQPEVYTILTMESSTTHHIVESLTKAIVEHRLAPGAKLVEQKLAIALEISQRVYVMGHGQIVFEGTPDELRANSQIRKEWLEV